MKRSIFVLLGLLLAVPAHAQGNKDSNWPTPAGNVVQGQMQMCVNTSGVAVPCQTVAGQTQVVASFSGADTGGQSISLPGVAGKTTFVCGWSVSGTGSTGGATVTITLGALVGGVTMSYAYVYANGASAPNSPDQFPYAPCLAANAPNTAITLTTPGSAGNTTTSLNMWGYQQ